MNNKDIELLQEAYSQMFLIEEYKPLLESLIGVFGNLGQKIRDYFHCRHKPGFAKEYSRLGQECPDSNLLINGIKHWMDQAKQDPSKRKTIELINRVYSQSKDIDDFLANLKAELELKGNTLR